MVTQLARETEKTLKALRAGGQLDAVDAASIALLRLLAARIDALEPESRTLPALVGKYQIALADLRGATRDTDSIDALVDQLAATGRASLGDASY